MAPEQSKALVGTAPGVCAVQQVATPVIAEPNQIIVKVSIGHVTLQRQDSLLTPLHPSDARLMPSH